MRECDDWPIAHLEKGLYAQRAVRKVALGIRIVVLNDRFERSALRSGDYVSFIEFRAHFPVTVLRLRYSH
jgi:hypothetical protein